MILRRHGRACAWMVGCAALLLANWVAASEEQLFVSPTGSDAATGTAGEPLASLHGAQRRLRAIRKADPETAIRITLAAGDYYLAQPVAFTAADSGTAQAPVTIEAAPDAVVRIIGGRIVNDFKPVEDKAILARLTPAAQQQVVVADLASQGITNIGEFVARGHEHELHPAGLELFYKGQLAKLARWPNQGWALTQKPQDEQSRTRFHYTGPAPRPWANLGDVWAHGFWEADWSDAWQPVIAHDAAKRSLTIQRSEEVSDVRNNARFYVCNVLEELDQPGEYCVDRATGQAYFWPPAKLEAGDVVVSQVEHPLSFYDVSHFTVRGLTFDVARACLVEIVRGEQVVLERCQLRNAGNLAINIYDGRKHCVRDCVVADCGEGGLRVEGGDRQTLTPGEHVIANNEIRNYARTCLAWRSAIGVHGVGIRIENNSISDGPDGAIWLSGNDHVVERNEIHHVCLETADVGAIYLGHDWTERGNVIRHNYLHNLGRFNRRDVMAVYLDDFASGTLVQGNVFVDAGRGVVIGGGRDNVVENNIFIDGAAGVQVDSRGTTWAKNYIEGDKAALPERLASVPAELYIKRYPELASLLRDEPAIAKGNRIDRNIFLSPITIDLHDNLTTRQVAQQGNWTSGDPKFVNRELHDYRLLEDSPLLARGFQQIPWKAIGRQARTRDPQVVSAPSGQEREY